MPFEEDGSFGSERRQLAGLECTTDRDPLVDADDVVTVVVFTLAEGEHDGAACERVARDAGIDPDAGIGSVLAFAVVFVLAIDVGRPDGDRLARIGGVLPFGAHGRTLRGGGAGVKRDDYAATETFAPPLTLSRCAKVSGRSSARFFSPARIFASVARR